MRTAARRTYAISAALIAGMLATAAGAALELGPEDASGSWVGLHEDTQVGAQIRGVGDVDDDGFGDFLAGGYSTGGPGPAAERHAMRLLLGSAAPLAKDVSVADAAGASFLSSASTSGSSPFLIHAGRAGDINNDGIDDMLMGAIGPTSYVYAVYGRANRSWGTNFDLENSAEIKIANSGDVQTSRFSGDVDFNNDGVDDFAIRDWNGVRGYFGSSTLSAFPAAFTTSGYSGSWSMGVGDFDGNGMNDVAASGNSAFSLPVQVRLHGKYIGPGGWSSGSLFSNTPGVIARERGDFDGDGFDEILLSQSPGPTALLFGRSNFPTEVSGGLPLAEATWTDNDPARRLGYGVQWLGDINGDGCDDFIAWHGPTTQPSDGLTTDDYAYVVMGNTTRPTSQQLVEDAAIRIGPFQGFPALREHISATDWNGDGLMDILIGAGGEDPGDVANAGKVFLYLAGDYPAATWFNTVRRTTAGQGAVVAFGPSRAFMIVNGNAGPYQTRVAWTDRAPAALPGALARTWQTDPGAAPSYALALQYTDEQLAAAGLDEASLVLLTAPAEAGPWTVAPFPVQAASNTVAVDVPQNGIRWWAIGAPPVPFPGDAWVID